MTKKRLLLIGGFLAACICLALGVAMMMPPGRGVTKANFDRIKNGMTMAEVERIVGKRQNLKNMTHGWTTKSRAASWSFRNDDGSSAEITYTSHSNSGVWTEYAVSEMSWKDEAEEEAFPDKLWRWLHID